MSKGAQTGNLVREAGALAGARLGVRVLGVLVGWVVARVIGPEGLGMLALPNFLLAVAPFLTLGFADGLVRELPRAGSDAGLRRSLLSSSWLAGLLSAALVLLVAGLFQSWPRSGIRDGTLYWLAVTAGLSHMGFKVCLSALTGSRRIRELALLQVLQGVLRAALVLILLFALPVSAQVYALHAGVAISLTASLLWAARRGVFSPPRWDSRALGLLGRSGPPMAVASLLMTMLVIGDRLVMSRHLSPVALGFYEQGVLMRDGLLLLPGVLLSVLIPNYSARQGDAALRPQLLVDVSRQSAFMAVGTPLLLGLALLQLPWLIGLLLPRFAPGLPVLQLAVLAMAPLFLSYILVSLLMSEGRALHVGVSAALCLGGMLLVDASLPAGTLDALAARMVGGTPPLDLGRALAASLCALAAFWVFSLWILLGNARRLELGWTRVALWVLPSLGLTGIALAGLAQGGLQRWNLGVNLAFLAGSALALWIYEGRSGQLSKVWRARRAVKS